MKTTIKTIILSGLIGYMAISSGCLKKGLDDLQNSAAKEMTTVDYTYRFLYTDTIQKGTPKEEIEKDRVCEVLFKKQTTKLTENGADVFQTTISYDVNSVLKAGPTGSVTKNQLYAQFQKLIQVDQLSKLWVYTTVSDVSVVTPLNGAPKLGSPGNFSKDAMYEVKAANGSTKNYILRTIKGF